jgi:hypothetical protein
VRIVLWVVGVAVGLVVLFVLFEYVVPGLLPSSF